MSSSDIVKNGVSCVPEGRKLFPYLTVLENLELGAYQRGGDIRDQLEIIYKYFPILKERRNQKAGSLSGGQQQMVAIARALMAKPSLLLLDEPSLGLAPKVVLDIAEIIQRLNSEEGMTILLVEQNANLALGIADRAIVLESGQLALEGPASELKDNDYVRKSYLGE